MAGGVARLRLRDTHPSLLSKLRPDDPQLTTRLVFPSLYRVPSTLAQRNRRSAMLTKVGWMCVTPSPFPRVSPIDVLLSRQLKGKEVDSQASGCGGGMAGTGGREPPKVPW